MRPAAGARKLRLHCDLAVCCMTVIECVTWLQHTKSACIVTLQSVAWLHGCMGAVNIGKTPCVAAALEDGLIEGER